jgi:hypothetical protein
MAKMILSQIVCCFGSDIRPTMPTNSPRPTRAMSFAFARAIPALRSVSISAFK